MMRFSLLTLIWMAVFVSSCSNEKENLDESDFQVENWFMTWEGDQPDYPLTNPLGEVVVIRGEEAKVGGSHFSFSVESTGVVSMTQTHDDGRLVDFSGTWKGQKDSITGNIVAILCDLTAQSTGAYRQYALMADSTTRTVQCYGTTKEPAFEVRAAE